jgi:hypothetical protein
VDDTLELHIHSPAFDKECAMYSKGIGKGPPSDDSDSDCYSDHSSLWEKDSSSSSVSSVESSCYNVSKFEAHLYYFGIRGPRRRGPKLIFRTSKDVRLVTRPSVGPDKFFDRRTGKAEFKIGIGVGCSPIRRSRG